MGLAHQLIVDRLVEYRPVLTVLHEYDLGNGLVVQHAPYLVYRARVEIEEVTQTTRKAPFDVRRGDCMPAVRNPFGDSFS